MSVDELHKLKTLQNLIVELREFLLIKEHNGFFFLCKRLKNMADYLEEQIDTPTEKFENIISDLGRTYKTFFSPRDGLSDFYIWHDDYDQRKKANDSYRKAKKSIEQILYPESGMFWSDKHLHKTDY